MRVSVRYELCEGHAVCQELCPEVFRMMGPKPVLLTTNPSDLQRPSVEAAARACPTRAIEVRIGAD